MKVLVIDIGGSHVKALVSGERQPREVDSDPQMTPRQFVKKVKTLTKDRQYDAVSLGYPGVVRQGRIVEEPKNLGSGWVKFDFEAAFGCPVKIMNDAAMQALGSYRGGTMLFLGFGTSVGSTLIIDWHIVPLALGDLPFKRGTFEDHLNRDTRDRIGRARWQKLVLEAVPILQNAMLADDVVLGGGNSDDLDKLPAGARRGDNDFAFLGGFRMWQEPPALDDS